MRSVPLFLLATALAMAGCSNLERSRNLADARVPATTLAQQVCSNCHGITGNSVSPNFPNLAAQVETYLVAQLTAFRSHGRHDPAGFEYMWGISRNLTDEQIKGLAAYYAARPLQAPAIKGDPLRLAAGQAIFDAGVAAKGVTPCKTCHGANGEGTPEAPRIAGQHADYIVKQLRVFQRTDDRPEGSVMKLVAHEMTRENVIDVAAYLQGLPQRR